ncbi:MAG: hypothetical protein HRT38_03955 [Alteromonadaceae bacterium]|nr:hypothetical protein [Alteromonadaceae bacterium]
MHYSQEIKLTFVRDLIEWGFSSETNSGVLNDNNVISGVFGSKCLLPPWAFSQKPVVQAVNQLDGYKKILLRFVVGLHVTHEEAMVLCVWLWTTFCHEYLREHRLNLASIPKAKRLLDFALINYKLSLAKQPLLVNKAIMKSLEISPSKFSRDWEPRFNVMKNIIAGIEHRALFEVLAVIDGRKGKKQA